MRIRQPLALLLGGLVSASSMGCAAYNAVLSKNSHPTQQSSPAGDRLVAIGRVFENQGNYERAESLYRSALRTDPRNEEIRQQLAELESRKNGRSFRAGTESAIAQADAVSGKAKSAGNATQQTTMNVGVAVADAAASLHGSANADLEAKKEIALTAASTTGDHLIGKAEQAVASTEAELASVAEDVTEQSDETAADAAALFGELEDFTAVAESAAEEVNAEVLFGEEADETSEQLFGDAADDSGEDHVVDFAEALVADEATGEADEIPESDVAQTDLADSSPVDSSPVAETVAAGITVEQLLAALESPELHRELLLEGLSDGDSEESKAIAATLLGELPASDQDAAAALMDAMSTAESCALKLAIVDSLIQRREFSDAAADTLLGIVADNDPAVMAQAVSAMRHCAETERRAETLLVLTQLLSEGDAEIRTAAALTLADFGELPQSLHQTLEQLADRDPDVNVREAAGVAVGRLLVTADSAEMEIQIIPR
ncbi:MAG: HEAT repeat domain-containing protein [Planctomycetaceae bacterium]|nr:HEAT repeat domain-containing protein [Planctomycetaceae bacterium]